MRTAAGYNAIHPWRGDLQLKGELISCCKAYFPAEAWCGKYHLDCNKPTVQQAGLE